MLIFRYFEYSVSSDLFSKPVWWRIEAMKMQQIESFFFIFFEVQSLDDCYFGSMMKRVPHVLEQNYNFMMGFFGVLWKINEGPDFLMIEFNKVLNISKHSKIFDASRYFFLALLKSDVKNPIQYWKQIFAL